MKGSFATVSSHPGLYCVWGWTLTLYVLMMIQRPQNKHLSLQHSLAGAEGLFLGLAGGQGGLAVLQLAPQPVDCPLLVPSQPGQVVPVLQIVLAALRSARLSLQQPRPSSAKGMAPLHAAEAHPSSCSAQMTHGQAGLVCALMCSAWHRWSDSLGW